MSRRFALLLSLVVAALLAPATAHAQWDPGATAMLGQGYGQNALSQSVMNNAFAGTRTGGGGRSGKRRPAKPRKPTARQLRTLRFTPDRAVTQAAAPEIARVLLSTCPPERTGCPANHGEIVLGAIASGDHRIRFRDNLRTLLGGTDRNVADGVAGFLLLAWVAQRPGTELTAAQRAGARRLKGQVRNSMALNAPARRLSARRKQQLVERLGALAQHGLSMRFAYRRAGFDAQAEDVSEQLRRTARELTSVDVARVRLARTGFVRR